MAKLPTITTITSANNNITTLNANFAALRNAFTNFLSRDGETPNTLTANIDMNSNELTNAAAVRTALLYIGGVLVNSVGNLNNWAGTWTTATAYDPYDTVYEPTNNALYRCLVAHTSGTFATDLGNDLWEVYVGEGLVNTDDATFVDLAVTGDLDLSGVDNAATIRSDLDVQQQDDLLDDIAAQTLAGRTRDVVADADGTNLGIRDQGEKSRAVALSGGAFDPTTATWDNIAYTRFPTGPALKPSITYLNEEFRNLPGVFSAFTSGTGTNSITLAPEGDAARIQRTNTNAGVILWSTPTALKSPIFRVETELKDWSVSTASYAIAIVGVASSINDFLVVEYDVVAGEIRLVERVGGGSFTTLASDSSFSQTGPLRIALEVNKAQVSLTVNDREILIDDHTHSTADILDMTPCIGQSVDGTNGVYFDFNSLRLSGPVAHGARDQNLVKFEDGSPVIVDGKYFVTMTLASPQTNSSWGVFSYDPYNNTFEQTACYAFDNHARLPGELIYDRNAGLWRIFVSGFGHPDGVAEGITMFTSDAYVLRGNHNFAGGTDLSLPLDTAGVAAYDPSILWDGSQWWMGYVITDNTNFSPESFYPALATSADLSSWTLVDADTTQSACEGTKICYVSGEIKLFAATRTNVRQYSDDMTLDGTITGLTTTSSPVSPPHFLPIPVLGQGVTEWYAIMFNGTTYNSGEDFTWGTLEHYKATSTETGFEHPTREL